MFKRKKKTKKYDDCIRNAVFTTVRDSLESILKAEYKITDEDGKEITDYELTARMMKTQARLVLDFISKTMEEKQ